MSRGKWEIAAVAACVVVTVAAVAYAVGKAQGASVQEVVKAKTFEVLDSAGNERAVLATAPDGFPLLSLDDKDGKARARLAVLPDGRSALTVLDRNGKLRVSLAVQPDGSPELALLDDNGKPLWRAR